MSQTLPPPPPPTPPPAGSRSGETTYVKFRNEVLAGGASDQPDSGDDIAGGPRAAIGLVAIAALLVLLLAPWIFKGTSRATLRNIALAATAYLVIITIFGQQIFEFFKGAH